MRVLALLLALAFGALADAAAAADRIRVVTTINDHRLLVEAVGGDLVEVDVLARPAQNPDDLEVRPSHMAKVRRADLLVINGLDVDAWVEAVVVGANNPKVVPGAPQDGSTSRGIPCWRFRPREWTAAWATCIPRGIPTTIWIPGSRRSPPAISWRPSRAWPPASRDLRDQSPGFPRPRRRGAGGLAARAEPLPRSAGRSSTTRSGRTCCRGSRSARWTRWKIAPGSRLPGSPRPAHPPDARREDQGHSHLGVERPENRRARGRRGGRASHPARPWRGRAQGTDTYFDFFDYNVKGADPGAGMIPSPFAWAGV